MWKFVKGGRRSEREMILGHNELKARLNNDLIVKPLSEDTIREAGLDLRLLDDVSIHPKSFKLCWTKEWVEFPVDLMGFCNLRSTYARMGLIIPPTIVDPGFKGRLVIEVFNANNVTVSLKGGERFLHVIIAECKDAILYTGKYQYQDKVV